MSLTILADENIPAVEHYLGDCARIHRAQGRSIRREHLQGVDVLLVRSVTRVDEALLAGSSIRFVGSATSGIDHVDRDYLTQHGIAFAYAPGCNANAVVEYVLSAIAAVDDMLERLLGGATVGIVGYGRIGKALAVRLNALGIRSLVHDPWLAQHSIPDAVALDAILDCDVISLHPELTTSPPWPSYHLFGEDQLRRLRAGTLLINASRGQVIDNAALLALLEGGHALRTVLDVWEGEPDINLALLGRVNLASAHIAGYSLDGKLRATWQLAEALTSTFQLSLSPRKSPAPRQDPLRCPMALSGAALLRFLLQARYDIHKDDALLRDALAERGAGLPSGEAFDQLRKTYRDRRELAGSAVDIRAPFASDLALVSALGCTLHLSEHSRG